MKKSSAMLLAALIFAFMGYGCDSGSTVTQEDAGYLSGALNAELYYPTNISGTAAATTMSAGYTQSLQNVEWLSQKLAENGYVVLAFTPDNTVGFVSQWRDLHKAAIQKLINFNNTHSVLRGKINTSKLQTCGHSKGGGGSLWASAQLGSQLKTTIGMAPYEEGFADSALGSITAATFIQAGGSDTLATNAMTRGEYNGLSDSISKMYVEYTGYTHLAWDGLTGEASYNATVANRISGDIIAWMKYYMDGQTSYASTLSNTSGTARHEWVDNSGSSSGSSGGSSSGGCN